MVVSAGTKFGTYEIVAPLGSGGMGDVYRARDARLGREVAIKVLAPDAIADEERRHRFVREARAASALSHPNVATIYEFGESEGRAFIAMELVEGQSLAARIGNHALPTRDVIDLALQITEALEEAHARGITHRDIKPGNIMVTPRGRIKVLDFGLARIQRDAGEDATTTLATRDGIALGTVPYMSPEQALGQDVDSRSDIFSLGAVIYEMATGARPFAGENSAAITDRILHSQPAAIARLNQDTPDELERIVRKCLVKDRERRYQSARDLAVDLGNLKRDIEYGSSGGAARTQPAAAPATHSMKQRQLIGIAIVLLLLAGAFLVVRLGRHAGAAKPLSSIAVLPLKNLSGNPDQDWFSDGMTESLIAELSKIKALKVISSTSVMQLKGTHKSLPEIGRDLGVEAIVEGSVLRVGNNVRITASLIEAAADRALWAHEYDSDMKDVLSLHREVARTVAGEIQVVLSPAERASLSQVHRIDPAVQDALLKGRYFYSQTAVDPENLWKALAEFEEAARLDPRNADAQAGIAKTYGTLGNWGLMPQAEAFLSSRDAALRALELDDSSPEAHKAICWWHFTWQHDWALAEREMKRAMELDPNDAEARMYYAQWLSVMGRHGEAILYAKRSHELAPLDLQNYMMYGTIYYWARDYDNATRVYREMVDLDKNAQTALEGLKETCLAAKKYDEAWQWTVKADRINPDMNDDDRRRLGEAYRAGGWPAVWKATLARLDRSKLSLAERAAAKGWTYAALGEKDKAFAELEVVYKEHGGAMFWLHDPVWDPIRNDPRFQDLRRRVNLPPE